MNWAWYQNLKPVPKLVLMALADAADDQGICWPSVATVATKVGVSTRTVRRVMQGLVRCQLLTAEQRHRSDGSCSSNRYRLLMGGGDRLSPAPDGGDTTPGHPRQGPPDTGVIPGTTRGTQKESPQPLQTETRSGKAMPENGGGGASVDLVYPNALSSAAQDQARQKLAGLPAELAQQLLDELAAGIRARVIRTTPLAYLRGLIARARAGTFTPEGALQVSALRRRRARVEAAMQRSEPRCHDQPPAAVDPENPLVRKLLDTRHRLQTKKHQED